MRGITSTTSPILKNHSIDTKYYDCLVVSTNEQDYSRIPVDAVYTVDETC